MTNPSIFLSIALSLTITACGDMPQADTGVAPSAPTQPPQALGEAPQGAVLSVDDQLYLRALAASYAYQGQMSNLVVTHTHSPDCRDFGRFVMERRDEVDTGLYTLAQRYQVGLPGVLSAKQSYRLHKLECCAWSFEKSYFKYMYKELHDLKVRSQNILYRSRNDEVIAWAKYAIDTIDLTIRLSAAGNTPDL